MDWRRRHGGPGPARRPALRLDAGAEGEGQDRYQRPRIPPAVEAGSTRRTRSGSRLPAAASTSGNDPRRRTVAAGERLAVGDTVASLLHPPTRPKRAAVRLGVARNAAEPELRRDVVRDLQAGVMPTRKAPHAPNIGPPSVPGTLPDHTLLPVTRRSILLPPIPLPPSRSISSIPRPVKLLTLISFPRMLTRWLLPVEAAFRISPPCAR